MLSRRILVVGRALRGFATTSSTPEVEATNDVDASTQSRVHSKDISAMRSRHRVVAAGGIPPMEYEWERDRHSLQQRFGTYGLESGVDVRQCWPTLEEIEEERAIGFYREYKDVLREVEKNKLEKQKQDALRLAELERNEKKYPEILAKYQASQVKKEREKDEKEVALEKKIREIQEYFGYWIDPKDPRFEVMFNQKEEEEKKAEKLAKRLEKQKKTIAEVL
ncbi:unnamed protein product, partial [Mesorhabditis spiculigera]